MSAKTDPREEFLKLFMERIVKNMVDAGMVKTEVKYPELEKIKANIKIYENPESTIANAIIMNQSPDIQRLMQPFEGVKEMSSKESSIASIMERNKDEPLFPIPIPVKQYTDIKKQEQIKTIRPILRPRSNLEPPFSQPMPFMHQKSGMRMLPSSSRSSIISPNENIPRPAPAAPEKTTILGLDKLDKILADIAVQTVECPGPNKQVLVYKSGSIQTANLSLTGDEIINIMKEVSQKTRIPIMSGVFKAAYGNLVITAVMSEFVGTRFIIQKKQLPGLPADSGYG